MARLRGTLLTACLQLLLVTGPVLSIEDHGSFTDEQCSAGLRQSPLDITSAGLQVVQMEPLVFEHYDVPLQTTVFVHDFHVTLHPQQGEPLPSVRGGDLGGTYVLGGLHFHWDAAGHGGSEHRLEGRQFDGEMHMVHYNQKYGGFEQAKLHPDGLAVIGSWLETEEESLASKDMSHSAGYQWMQDLAENYLSTDGDLEKLPKEFQVSNDLSNFLYSPLHVGDLFPTELSHFFRYNGSLTTNPCSETVTWTVFRTPVTVPYAFMKMLQQGKVTVRAPQPLNNRTILYGGDMASYYTGAGLAPAPCPLWTLPPLLVLLKVLH